MDFPKKQQQCLIPRYLLQYLQDLQISHNDPTVPWGGGGGGSYTAGDGIEISDEDVISIDNTVALKTDIPSLTGYATETWVTNQGYLVQSDLSGYVTSTDLATELLDYAELSDLATVATTGDYDDLLNKPDLSVYELAEDAFSGDYNDLLNKPTIPTVPTNVSAFTNDAGYITSSALTGYATETWVTNQGYSTFSGNYNDLSNKPNLSNYVTTNTEQNITKVKTIYNTSNGHSDIYFKAPLNDNSSNTMGFSAFDYNNSQIGGLQIMNRALQFNSDESSTYYYGTFLTNFRNDSNSLNTVTGFRVLPSDRYSGSYSINFVAPIGTQTDLYDIYKSNSNVNTVNLVAAITDGTNTVLANKLGVADISSLLSGGGTTVSGTNDGTNWTSITIGSDTYGIPSGGGGSSYSAGTGINITNNTISVDSTVVALKSDIPSTSSFVDLTSDQNITGVKTFLGEKKLAFKQSANLDVIGFTAYNNNNVEIGNLQVASRLVGGNRYNYVTLGNYSSNSTKSKLGFRVQPNSSSNSFNFVMPYGTNSNFTSNGYYTNIDTTFPFAFTDGTTKIKADDTGLVDLSTLNLGSVVSGTNDGTNWTSLTINGTTKSIPSGGSGSGPAVYNFTSSDWSGLTTSNSYINQTAMAREGLDLSTLTAGQTVKIDCVFVRPSNNTSYVHQFTLVIPDGTMATESTDTFQIPGTYQTSGQIEAFMVIASNKIGLFWSNTAQTRYISKVKVYPANA